MKPNFVEVNITVKAKTTDGYEYYESKKCTSFEITLPYMAIKSIDYGVIANTYIEAAITAYDVATETDKAETVRDLAENVDYLLDEVRELKEKQS